jgi:Fe-S cluster biogenesis protein NfuA
MMQQEVQRIEALLDDVERLGDPAARATATELVQALLDMYGEGLRRIADRVDMRELAGDELVCHLLLLHGLHPVPVQERVVGALDEMRPYLDAHGGDVRLLGVEDGVVRLQLQGSCSGCPSSAVTLKHAVEDAIHKAAPDVEEIVAEDGEAPTELIQLEVFTACPAPMHP